MPLEVRMTNLIDKHQKRADKYHRLAEDLYLKGQFEKSVETDKLAHKHEAFALKLREELKRCTTFQSAI